MGIDLTLLPFYDEHSNFSTTVLELNRDYKLQEEIKTLPMLDISDDFMSYLSRDEKYEDSHFGLTLEDCYGDRIKYTTAKELLKIKDYVDKRSSYKNKAAWAYISELPPNSKIALYWH